MQDIPLSVGSTPTPRRLRAVNASLPSIRASLKPLIQDKDGNYFRFANGQIRRQIGQGHSHAERSARRVAKRLRKTRQIAVAGAALSTL